MADVLTKEQRSYNMSRIRGENTKPEITLRKLLYSKGLRGYRTRTSVYGKPDIVFPRFKVAVFVDGCFWHKCPRCFVRPETNKDFWRTKIDGNVRRDGKVNDRLKREGYKVIRLWEHEVKKDASRCFKKIHDALKRRGFEKTFH